MIITKSVTKLVEKYDIIKTIVNNIDHSKDIHFEMVDLKDHAEKILFPFDNSKAFASISKLSNNQYILVLEGNNKWYGFNYNYISKDLNKVYCKLTRLKNGDFKVLSEMDQESGLSYQR